MNLKFKIEESAKFIARQTKIKPAIAIVLGSGLGPFAEEIENAVKIPYSKIPHFKQPSVVGHDGMLIIGTIKGVPVIIQQGRWHYYEGYTMDDVVLPIRVFAKLGVKTLILTNAAGGVNINFKVSQLMVISDHINLMGNNPLKGESAKIFGEQFPDMSEVYNKEFQKQVIKLSKKLRIELASGVYAALSGPNYETPAEIKMLRVIGADAVGMSTVPEAIAARHLGLNILGMSCITNMAAGITNEKLHHSEVKEAANKSMKNFIKLIKEFIVSLK